MLSAHRFIAPLALVFLMVFGIMASNALAQEGVGSNLEPVVVTATRNPKKISSVSAAVSVVTREDLEKTPGSVLDALREATGLIVFDERGAYGSSTNNKTILRGMGGGEGQSRVLVLIDGLPATPPGTGIFEWSAINKSNVERIEVVRGPSSALYGAEAMGGVINIITKSPEESGFDTRIKTRFGNRRTQDANVFHTGGDRNFGYTVALGRNYTKGFNALHYFSRTAAQGPPALSSQAPETVINYTVDVKFKYNFDDTANIALFSNFTTYDRTGRYQAPRYNPDMWVIYKYDKRSFGMVFNKDFGVIDSSLGLRYDHASSNYYMVFSSTYQTPSYQAPLETDMLHIDLNNVAQLGDSNVLTFGLAHMSSESRRTYRYRPPSARFRDRGGNQKNYGLFAQDEISLLDGRLTLIPGVRYDIWRTRGYEHDSQLNLSRSDGWITESHFSPKLGVVINPWGNKVILRANYGDAFRVGSIEDRFGSYEDRTNSSNTALYTTSNNLKPEVSRTFDFGVEVNVTERLDFNLTGYLTQAKDYIANILIDNAGYNYHRVYLTTNLDKVQIRGLEGGVNYRPFDFLTFFANGELTQAKIQGGPDDGHHINNTPESKVTLGASFSHPDWFSARLAGNYIGRTWMDQTENARTTEGDFWLMEARLSKRFDFQNWWIEPFFEATNLTDKKERRLQYQSRIPLNNFYAGLEIGF